MLHVVAAIGGGVVFGGPRGWFFSDPEKEGDWIYFHASQETISNNVIKTAVFIKENDNWIWVYKIWAGGGG